MNPRPGVRLFAFYAIVTLIPIVVIGIVLARAFRSDLDRQGLQQGVSMANSVARSAIDPILSGDSLTHGPTPAERELLVDAAEPLLQSGQALEVRIRDSEGHVVFDPSTPDRGPFGPRDPGVIEAITEAPVRQMTHMNADEVDGAATINEVLGPENGDRFLVHVAERLRASVSPEDFVGRIGGDEFGIISANVEERVTDRLIADVRRALLQEIEVGGVELATEIAVGRVVAHRDDRASEVLRRSGVACRTAEAANAEIVDYDQHLETFDTDRLALVAQLRHNIDSGQLVLHYQPKVASRDGAVLGVEALVRWQHPTRGLLAPGVFLPAVESTGLIGELTDWVIDEAERQAAEWDAAGIRVPIAVNISARCLRDPAFADRMIGALNRRQVSPDLISIEITETAVIADPQRAAATLRRLSARGIKVSIDDFGVGFTSISHLDTLPIDELKIDRQFVAAMIGHRDGRAMVRGIVSLGHELGMTVVAEGVEDDATLAAIAELGCDIAQGYLIARPAPAAEFEAWCRRATEVAPPASVTSPV